MTQHYHKHVFFCLNSRDDGRQSCAEGEAERFRAYTKATLKTRGISNIRINGASCLGRCKAGPGLVVYPEGTWYRYQNQEDIDEIINEHLLAGRVVTRLLMPTREASGESAL